MGREVECAGLQAREIIDGEDVVEEGFYARDRVKEV